MNKQLTQDDRDNYFIVMLFESRLKSWAKTKESMIDDKDRKKLDACSKILCDFVDAYIKKEGNQAFLNLVDESKQFKIAVIPREEELAVSETFESTMIRSCMRNVVKQCNECNDCSKCDYLNCDWFTLHKFIGDEQINHKKGECPFKVSTQDLFNVEDEEL